MAGAYYIWIMLAFFGSGAGILDLFTLLLYHGHRLEKKATGSTHGFLELPPELQSRPAPPSSSLPPEDPPGPPASS
jgi:hypothetical protein